MVPSSVIDIHSTLQKFWSASGRILSASPFDDFLWLAVLHFLRIKLASFHLASNSNILGLTNPPVRFVEKRKRKSCCPLSVREEDNLSPGPFTNPKHPRHSVSETLTPSPVRSPSQDRTALQAMREVKRRRRNPALSFKLAV
jgi:hypothetical protein